MSFPLIPFFRWGFEDEEVELTLTYPMRPWKPGRGGVGGSATAASGTPEAYVVRRDRIYWLELRVLEEELPDFDEFLDWAQDYGEPFTIRLDADEPSTEFSVYLHSPRWEDGAEVQYTRDADYPGLFIIPVAIRTELGGTFDMSWNLLTVDA